MFDIDSPQALLRWDPPNLDTNSLGKYAVMYDEEEYVTNNTFLEINLMFDKMNVGFDVYVKSADRVLRDGVTSYCEIQSTLERRTGELHIFYNLEWHRFICSLMQHPEMHAVFL